MPQPPDGLEPNGMLKPPRPLEDTDVKSEGLAHPELPTQPTPQPEMKMMSMDEADTMRASIAFRKKPVEYIQELDVLNEMALQLSLSVVKLCPAGKERSQALGNVQQVVLWARASIENKVTYENSR